MKKIDVSVGVIVKEGRVLLTQRNAPKNPAVHLKWQLPGGGVENNETKEDACIRELMEETGYTVKIIRASSLKISNIYDNTQYVLHGFKCEIVSGTINIELDEETNDAKWFKLEEIKSLQALDDTYELVVSCLDP